MFERRSGNMAAVTKTYPAAEGTTYLFVHDLVQISSSTMYVVAINQFGDGAKSAVVDLSCKLYRVLLFRTLIYWDGWGVGRHGAITP